MHPRTMAASVAVGSAAVAVALMATVTPARAALAVPSAHRYVAEVCGVTNDVPALSYSNGAWYRYTCRSALFPWTKVR